MTQHRLSANRREFLTCLAAAAAAPQARASGVRVGCCSWCFHSLGAGAYPEEAIEIIGGLGFDGIELIANAQRDVHEYWSGAGLERVQKLLGRHRLQVTQFALFQPVVEDLSSRDAGARGRGLDFFETGCKIAKKLGSPIINFVAPWARELRGPTDYLPRYYEIGNPKPGEKFHIEIAPSFDWDEVWKQFIQTVRECLARAKSQGLRMTIEHHTHTILPDATAFLRLWDVVRDPALGCNLDIGWTLLQREYPPVAIHKLKTHLMNLHMRDIDGRMRTFVNVGDGVMDFKAIAEALKAVGFRGCLSLEQDRNPGDMKAVCRGYLQMMRNYLA
jgi:sugar phosphate isomerase/epimerase